VLKIDPAGDVGLALENEQTESEAAKKYKIE
jgi:hypothetical protein